MREKNAKVLYQLKSPFRVGWKTRSAECGVWKMRSMENEEYGKCGVWKMRSIACGNPLTFLFNIKNA